MTKTKIILDADVIIHFAKGELLSLLPNIFKEYDYVVLSHVYKEIHDPIKLQLDNQISLLKNISIIKFNPTGEVAKEYASLRRNFGSGESACMAYCKFNPDIIGSSNLKDITNYCKMNKLTYLSTIDFLYYAIQRNIIKNDEAYLFIQKVKSLDSKLPLVNFSTYIPSSNT